MKQQMQQQQIQADAQTNQRNLIAKIVDTLLKKGIDAHTKLAELDDKHIQSMADLFLQQQQTNRSEQHRTQRHSRLQSANSKRLSKNRRFTRNRPRSSDWKGATLRSTLGPKERSFRQSPSSA